MVVRLDHVSVTTVSQSRRYKREVDEKGNQTEEFGRFAVSDSDSDERSQRRELVPVAWLRAA